ncbi:MAG: MBL fold metallo-hydrolase [Clostridiales bacterium]|nr:MBL fold metallo-hydrolase [Clostridiales bacterium]
MTTVYMLTSQSSRQMMSFIITDGKKLVVIDGGYTCDADYLCTYVRSLGGVIDAWYLTHPHSDHIDALYSMLERHTEDLKIGTIYYNFPSDEYIANSGDNDDPMMHVTRLREQLKLHNCDVRTVQRGDVHTYGEITIRVLRTPDETIDTNHINNSSVVYRLDASGRSMIFLGDLGVEGGNQLLEMTPPELLKADYVQCAHHGQQGVDKNVYDAIDPDYCFWCTPDWLWDNDAGKGYDTHIWKTIVTRGWLSDLGIKWHYVSKDGTQEARLGEENELHRWIRT